MNKKTDKLIERLNSSEEPKNNTPAESNVYDEPKVVEEQIDPNAVVVQISNTTPIVIFWGPTSIGKTVALISLSKFLETEGYEVKPVPSFRLGDEKYQALCKNFRNEYLKKDIAPSGTGQIDFLLLSVQKEGQEEICQILEAPGEHFFNPENPESGYPPYIERIRSSTTPKIYVTFLERDWQVNNEVKTSYDRKIVSLIARKNKSDYLVLLVNKADKFTHDLNDGKPIIDRFKKKVSAEYSHTFTKIGAKSFFGLGAEKHKHTFVVFSAGSFTKRSDGEQTFTESHPYYPHKLWEAIYKDGIVGSLWPF